MNRRPVITVLLVEDSLDARETLVTLLEMHGLRVIGAATAAEALAAGRQHPTIHLLLSDLHLPDGSGAEVAAGLQRIHPAMRSLFMSGDGAPALGAGQAYLQKPAGIAAVLREIAGLLRS
jgi:CheY-like chemotaxis protein